MMLILDIIVNLNYHYFISVAANFAIPYIKKDCPYYLGTDNDAHLRHYWGGKSKLPLLYRKNRYIRAFLEDR
jgi:hypothetical protein